MKTIIHSTTHTHARPTSFLEPIRIERTITASPQRVFTALTCSTEMEKWFFSRCVTAPKRFGRFELRWESLSSPSFNDCRYGDYLEFEHPKKLRFTWRGVHILGKPTQTSVSIWLSPSDHGCTLLLIHRGWQTGSGWRRRRDEHESQWRFFLENLARYIRQEDDLRPPEFRKETTPNIRS